MPASHIRFTMTREAAMKRLQAVQKELNTIADALDPEMKQNDEETTAKELRAAFFATKAMQAVGTACNRLSRRGYED